MLTCGGSGGWLSSPSPDRPGWSLVDVEDSHGRARAGSCGGGVTGVAWEIGLIAGLARLGIDLAGADVIIGTAGSVVGADIACGQELEALYQAPLAPPAPEPAARMGWGILGRLLWVMSTSRDPVRWRARIGSGALAAPIMPESSRRKVIEARVTRPASSVSVMPRCRAGAGARLGYGTTSRAGPKQPGHGLAIGACDAVASQLPCSRLTNRAWACRDPVPTMTSSARNMRQPSSPPGPSRRAERPPLVLPGAEQGIFALRLRGVVVVPAWPGPGLDGGSVWLAGDWPGVDWR
jgi:hypothetical protein